MRTGEGGGGGDGGCDERGGGMKTGRAKRRSKVVW